MPLLMLMIPYLCSLLSWKTLRNKLFLRLCQYQTVSINHGFLTIAKMQSKNATGPSRGNLNAYHIARAKARRDFRHNKKTSWRNCVSRMKYQTSVISVWNRIRKIKGKESSNIIHNFSVNDRDDTSHLDIANAFLIIFPLLSA